MRPIVFVAVAGLCLATPPPGALAQGADQSVAASAWSPEPTALPDTDAGRCIVAYVAAFNDGEAAMSRFESEHRSPAAIKERPIEARLEAYRGMKRSWGGLRAHSVLDPEVPSVLMETATPGQWLITEWQFESPGVVKAIILDGPMGSDELRQRLEPVDDETRAQTIKAIVHQLRREYVFPDVADKMAESIQNYAGADRYAKIVSAAELARVLTDDLRAVCHDKHLRVRVNTGGPSAGGMPGPDEAARRNYGFTRVEILPNNIGYIRFDNFLAMDQAREPAAAAMAFVANCDALIFDMRYNGGGSPRMIEFIAGYLYESPTVLNTFVDRKGRKVSQTRTLEEVPGKRFRADLPVYVLTSGRTFSCAEEFSYDLQTTGRGTIVGETTGGGAHPVKGVPLNDRFGIMIPYERAENPITKSNWEGKGVEPEIKVPADKALEAACDDAVHRIRKAER